VVWVERHGAPFALAPLLVRPCRYYGLERRVLCFLGEGNSDRSDILIKTPDPEMYGLLFSYLRSKIHWHVASFREIPEQSGLLSWAASHNLGEVEKDSECPYITFKPEVTLDVYRATLSRNLRREFSNISNRLRKIGEHRFRCQVLIDHDTPELEMLRDIELQSAKASRNIHLVFSPDKNFKFQQRLLKNFDETFQPLLTTLELNEKVIAYLYGFIIDGVYHAYNTAFLPEYVRFSPGKLTIQETINYCITEKLQEFDFMRGNSYIKSKWSNVVRKQFHLTIMEEDFLNRLHRQLIFRVRPALKIFLEKLKGFFKPD